MASSSEENGAVSPPSPVEAPVTPKYSVLRQWLPNNQPQGFGADILLEQDATLEELTSFLKGLGNDKDPVSISVYTSRQVYLDAQKDKYGKPYKQHFVAMYVKNGRGRGAFSGFNEIRWMQEEGTYSQMFGKVTKF